MKRLMLPLLLLLSAVSAPAHAAHVVEVLETYPSGQYVTLGPGEKFYVRIAYSTDSMTRIFARPYRDGKEVGAINSPSPRYEGSGETVAWFSFPDTDDKADEIRLFVGNSNLKSGAVYKVFVEGGARTAAPAPAWVGALESRVVEATGGPQSMPTVSEERWFTGFMLVVAGLAVFGLVAPIWCFLRWHGRWKIAAAVPMAGMGLFAVFLLLAATFDPGSLNLLPFVVLMAAVPSSLFLAILFLARALTRTNRRAAT